MLLTMKKITSIVFGIISIAFVSCGNKQQVSAEQMADSTHYAELTYIEDFYDAGTVHSGEIVKHSFEFKNTGNIPLVIKDIIPSCGCTKVDVTQKTLKPGEKAKLIVEFNSKGWFGSQYKSVTLRTNGVIREKSATLKVNVVQ
jgi:hypothetical protein